MERTRLPNRNVRPKIRLSIRNDRNPISPPIRSQSINLNRRLPSVRAPGAFGTCIHVSFSGKANSSQLLKLVSTFYNPVAYHLSKYPTRTILLYPTTAYLVLFCNVVATSDIGDFNLMKAIADCLAQTGISYPLVQLRTLFQKFLGLSRGFFNDERNAIQMIHTSGMESSLSYPVGNPNPFMLSWDRDPLVFNQLDSCAATESFSEMLNVPQPDLYLPYGDSSFSVNQCTEL